MIDHFETSYLESNLYLTRYKRYFDVIMTTFLLILNVPILTIVSILIKISSKGPIIYKQQRVGIHGRLFVCYKFRTMYNSMTEHETERLRESMACRTGILDKKKDDERVTKMGSLLRKTSIDELPQLFNVLRGDMSLVGPRPLIPFMLEPFPEITRNRCRVLPGLTGLWQVRGRKKNTTV